MHKVRPCTDDATCVKQLRSCGAILVGKTNMHELGAGTSGINPHHGYKDVFLYLAWAVNIESKMVLNRNTWQMRIYKANFI